MAEYTPPEIALEQRKIDRRRKMAELLAQQDPMQSQMVSGHYVGASPVQGIANLAKAYLGAKANRKLDTEETDLTTRDQQMRREDIAKAMTRMEGITPNVNGVPSMMRPISKQEGITEAIMSQRPEVQAMGQYRQGRLDTASDTAAQNAFDLRLEQQKAADDLKEKQYGIDQNNQTKLDIARIMADSKADPAAPKADFRTVKLADGTPKTFLATDVDGITAAINAGATEITPSELNKQEGVDLAKSRVSGNLETLSEYYKQLSSIGAAVDSSKSDSENLSARIRSSAAGQTVGGALGTEEQTIRDNIKQMQPLLLNEIRQATAMGARGMDSNSELKFYLQAVTDPNRSIQSNMAAIAVLENAYGSGSESGVDPKYIEELKAEFLATNSQNDAKPNGIPDGAQKASDGNWYVKDPNRPGKYLRVTPE